MELVDGKDETDSRTGGECFRTTRLHLDCYEMTNLIFFCVEVKLSCSVGPIFILCRRISKWHRVALSSLAKRWLILLQFLEPEDTCVACGNKNNTI